MDPIPTGTERIGACFQSEKGNFSFSGFAEAIATRSSLSQVVLCTLRWSASMPLPGGTASVASLFFHSFRIQPSMPGPSFGRGYERARPSRNLTFRLEFRLYTARRHEGKPGPLRRTFLFTLPTEVSGIASTNSKILGTL